MLSLQAVELDVLDMERLTVYPGPVYELDIDCIEVFILWIGGHMRPDIDDFAAVHLAFAGILAAAAIYIAITDVRNHQIPL
jgi:hypothetical protein